MQNIFKLELCQDDMTSVYFKWKLCQGNTTLVQVVTRWQDFSLKCFELKLCYLGKFVGLTQYWCFLWFIPWRTEQGLAKLRVGCLVLRHKTPVFKNAWKSKWTNSCLSYYGINQIWMTMIIWKLATLICYSKGDFVI